MTVATVIEGTQEFLSLANTEVGVSDWLTIEQEMINDFGKVTRDEQWIHVDPEKAADGPFGTTIAHGLLTLSLIPVLANQAYEVRGFSARVNYGFDTVRFLAPVKSGERIRNRVSILNVETTDKGARVKFAHRLEAEGREKPVCLAEMILLFTK